MLAHRLRRWPNIKTTLAQRLVFAGNLKAWLLEAAGPEKTSLAEGKMHFTHITCIFKSG